MDTTDDDSQKGGTALQAMIEEFRTAKQRQLVQRGKTLWNRTAAQYALEGLPTAEAVAAPLPDEDAGHD